MPDLASLVRLGRPRGRAVGPRRAGQHGAVAGLEGLVFGALVLLAGSLVLVNAWAVVESRSALDTAAREYLRAYTRQADRRSALRAGEEAARLTLAGRGTRLHGLQLRVPAADSFGPCGLASVRLRARVPRASVPFLGPLGDTDVTVTHSELIGPHRELTPDPRFDAGSTACAGN
jgi:hypothetical protein